MTALENVELPLRLTNLNQSERVRHATLALELVGLGDRLNHSPRQLSGGQEQRVAVARAIATDPDLLLADEPTGNPDAAAAQEVLTIFARLSRDFKKTIVMVTHDPNTASSASRRLHLEKGTLLAETQHDAPSESVPTTMPGPPPVAESAARSPLQGRSLR
jgi:putative ABC transport system ATP-binding protein